MMSQSRTPDSRTGGARNASDYALWVRGLRVTHKSRLGPVEIVHGIDLAVEPGETLGLVGESGSGKSLTGKGIMGLTNSKQLSVETDELTIAGARVSLGSDRLSPGVGMIFQNPFTSLNPAFTIGSFLVDVIQHKYRIRASLARKRALELLDAVKIPDARKKLHSYPHQMSGGQQQRVVIAVALALEPKLLIADEPTTALDVTVQAEIIRLLKELQRDMGMGMIFISHDLSLVSDIADSVSVMYHGDVVEHGGWNLMTGAAQHPYTQMLLAASPSVHRRSARLSVSRNFERDLVL